MAETRKKRNIQAAQPNTTVIYARYSSTNQREESIDAQLRSCKAYAQQNNLIIIGEYCDSAKTGTNDDRPEFQRMIKDSEEHTFCYVLVHKLDRFSRDRYDSAINKRRLKLNGSKVISVLERLDDSPESSLMETLMEGLNEYYSKNLAREVEKGKKETAYQYKHTGGLPPIGYDVDPITKKYVINESEAKEVLLQRCACPLQNLF